MKASTSAPPGSFKLKRIEPLPCSHGRGRHWKLGSLIGGRQSAGASRCHEALGEG